MLFREPGRLMIGMRSHPAGCRWGTLSLACLLAASCLSAQKQPHFKLGPPSLVTESFILLDNVVTEQWPATLSLVNAPASLRYLSPGQCIRAGVAVTGKDHETLISGVAIGFTVQMGETQQNFPLAPPQATKQIKPEGSDFVIAALDAAHVKAPDMTVASMAASSAKWCVPALAQPGPVRVDVTAEFQNKTRLLKPATVAIESMTHPQVPFTDLKGVSEWMMSYYTDPRPALLIPALRLLPPEQLASPNIQELLLAAFRADPVAAGLLGDQLAATPKPTQLLVLSLLSQAGIHLAHPIVLDNEEQTIMENVPPVPDPCDLTTDQKPPSYSRLDMLWAEYFATGTIQPVKCIASALAWRADYDAFEQLKKSGQRSASLTDSIIRGVTFGAAGWSLDSFYRSDPLAIDYIDAMKASPDTPPAVKKELLVLDTDPAFRDTSHQ